MKALLALALTFSSASAFALWTGADGSNGPTSVHIYSEGMKCVAVQDAVSANGAVIIHHGDHMFDRVVADSSYCSRASHEIIAPFWAPTRDTDQCFAGYTCQQNNGN